MSSIASIRLESEMAAFVASGKPIVLLVDDDEIGRMLLSEQLRQSGYQVIEAASLDKTRQLLKDPEFVHYLDVMILDRELYGMDGLNLARSMKTRAEWKHIPIIMLTGHDQPSQVQEGLKAGVFYYLTKPAPQGVLHSVLELALQEMRRHRTLQEEVNKHRASFLLMESCKFEFSTLAHVDQLACFMANCFADPARVLTGLAELMVNAIEHGMLGITYAEKGELLKQGTWHQEIDRRAALPENKGKKAEAVLTRRPEGCYVSIRDFGAGFNWRDFLTFDPARAGDMHGRGIAQAAISFDQLAYNEIGNEAVGFLGQGAALTW